MLDLDRGVEMEWEQSVTITPEQAVRLILMKEKADRIRKAILQQRELLSWIWSSLNAYM